MPGCIYFQSRLTVCISVYFQAVRAQYDTQLVRPDGMPRITNLEVMCAKDRMTVQIGFSKPFQVGCS